MTPTEAQEMKLQTAKLWEHLITYTPEHPILTDAESKAAILAALTEAYERGRRDQMDVDMRTVQSLCNEECKAYKQDKSGCNHPDGESVHNGNVVRVADNFRIWYISEVATKEGK